jgi:hypothetical protein
VSTHYHILQISRSRGAASRYLLVRILIGGSSHVSQIQLLKSALARVQRQVLLSLGGRTIVVLVLMCGGSIRATTSEHLIINALLIY